jgi:hypothetical protein
MNNDKRDIALQELTYKFLEDFTNLSTSFEINNSINSIISFDLPKCLVNSEYLIKNLTDKLNVLIGKGFVDILVKKSFEKSIELCDFNNKIQFILNNIDKQDEFNDCVFENLNITNEQIIIEVINEDFLPNLIEKIEDENTPLFIKKEVTRTIYGFKPNDRNSNYVGYCEVFFIDNEYEKTILYDENNVEKLLTIENNGDTNMAHYRYVAEINKFFDILYKVELGINEKSKIGYIKGEKCNRNGCDGIINEIEVGDGCSCHINPPCSYCCNLNQYCDECGWENEQ